MHKGIPHKIIIVVGCWCAALDVVPELLLAGSLSSTVMLLLFKQRSFCGQATKREWLNSKHTIASTSQRQVARKTSEKTQLIALLAWEVPKKVVYRFDKQWKAHEKEPDEIHPHRNKTRKEILKIVCCVECDQKRRRKEEAKKN